MIGCCELALVIAIAAFVLILALLAMFFNYSLKIKDRQIILEKNQAKIKQEVAEVERVNGKEKKAITELQKQVQKISEQLIKHPAK
jgi:Tfp pilus assembly protein PilN